MIISELAARIVAIAASMEYPARQVSDAVAELFGRLTEGLPDNARGLLAGMVNRRLGVQVL